MSEPVVNQNNPRGYDWAFQDTLPEELLATSGRVPARWGRMTPLSRLLIVDVGRLLLLAGLLPEGGNCFAGGGVQAGLIGCSSRGSLQTDQDFIDSMKRGVGLASPALFGYTLPNTPLAEAAGHYGLVGPVYALLADREPFDVAVREATQLLRASGHLDFMIAGVFDHIPPASPEGRPQLVSQLKVIHR